MKEVTHRIDKDCAWLPPAQWYLKGMFVERHLETVGIIPATRGFQTASHTFGVAVLTARADFGTSGNRVPG
jgi:hypothetical protein